MDEPLHLRFADSGADRTKKEQGERGGGRPRSCMEEEKGRDENITGDAVERKIEEKRDVRGRDLGRIGSLWLESRRSAAGLAPKCIEGHWSAVWTTWSRKASRSSQGEEDHRPRDC